MSFPLGLVCVLCVAGFLQFNFYRFKPQNPIEDWDNLVEKLDKLNMPELKRVASSYLHPEQDLLSVSPGEMWTIIGGTIGLQKLVNNANVMIGLACYAERWNVDHGFFIAECMRQDATRIRGAVRRIELNIILRRVPIRSALHLHEAISSYWLMHSRLLALYGICHEARLQQLLEIL